jgi:hypothetical protein
MRRFCHPLCSVAKQNRNTTPRHLTVNGEKIFISPKSSLQSDGLVAVLELSDRMWHRYQEELLDGYDSIHPFIRMNLTEPHLLEALRAKGYL